MKVLFVCTGNTCRSPLAEGYLKNKNLPCLEVQSAGLMPDGVKASQNSILAAKTFGFDISGHKPRQITSDLILNSDKIYCMSESHKSALAGIVPESKLSVLGSGIPDPYGLDLDYYIKTAEKIMAATDNIFADILPADKKDCADIEVIERTCFSAPWSRSAIEQSLDNGTVMYKAVLKGKTVGYIGINTVLDEGYITNIGILPEFRRNGTAQRLLEKLECDYKEKLSFISLEVRVSNLAAISLYKKLGYQKAGERRSFYINPTENALIMTKGLK
ncbi:MAG: ribosomal protein S18-alanine N-acetyltransferase [Clostridiales bacterium]|nr:ribosomal protein S18-alanine N-acetyltransferase [Candidatus Equinaster intestinalis]